MCVTQGHYRRAVVLEKLGQTETAASSYLLCLHLGGMEHPVARLLSEVKGKTLEHTHMHAHNNNIYTCTIIHTNVLHLVHQHYKHFVFKVIDNLLRELPNRQTDRQTGVSHPCTPQQLSADIVRVATEQLRHFQRLNQDMDEETDVSASLVDISDFECVLCTG